MAKPPNQNPQGAPKPPAPKKGAKPSNFGGYKKQDPKEFEHHAGEIKTLAGGGDIVESQNPDTEQRPAPFDREELQVVRSWVKSRPLEPHAAAPAMIPYPRSWNSKRGRYCKFKSPGAGVYGILRARPTY